MFFVTAIRSAAGAANYFAKDNYYTQGENAELSAWGGQGAAALGLAGIVDKDTFEAPEQRPARWHRRERE
jgi:hypothetical protein